MPPEREQCGECGNRRAVCPECGGSHVSADLVNAGDSTAAKSTTPSPNHRQFALYAPAGDGYVFQHVCWDCGWKERREVTVAVIDPRGDDS